MLTGESASLDAALGCRRLQRREAATRAAGPGSARWLPQALHTTARASGVHPAKIRGAAMAINTETTKPRDMRIARQTELWTRKRQRSAPGTKGPCRGCSC